MSMIYYIVSKSEYTDYNKRVKVWNKAINSALKSFQTTIKESKVKIGYAESLGEADINEMKENFSSYIDLKGAKKIGITWFTGNGRTFKRQFGDQSRTDPDDVWNDLMVLVGGNVDEYVVVNEFNQLVKWEELNQLIFGR